jgi:hypothetical protein
MPTAVEQEFTTRPISTTREPVGPKNAGSKGSPGDVALMDAVAIVLIAWVVLFLLGFSLRRHNI